VGVLLGYWLSKWLTPQKLNVAVAILLLFISGLLLNDMVVG
jgi:putative Ca2+/H+ antiporter (TMEM165/GDT1 family)